MAWRQRISWLAERLLASQEGLCSMELVNVMEWQVDCNGFCCGGNCGEMSVTADRNDQDSQ